MCLHLVDKINYILIVHYVQIYQNTWSKKLFGKAGTYSYNAESSLKSHSMHNFYLIKHSWRYFLHSITLPNSITKNRTARLRMHKCSNPPISHRYVEVQLFEPKIYILPLKLTVQKITLYANYKCITARIMVLLKLTLLRKHYF